MASEQDHYAVLRVHPDAEPEVITAAYRSLARLYHPDRNRSPDAARRMAQINIAYDVLSDPPAARPTIRAGRPVCRNRRRGHGGATGRNSVGTLTKRGTTGLMSPAPPQ